MKVIKRVLTRKDKTAQVFCNKCGLEIAKFADDMFEDYLEVSKRWGYFSPSDGESHSFDICRKCYDEFARSFEIALEVKE